MFVFMPINARKQLSMVSKQYLTYAETVINSNPKEISKARDAILKRLGNGRKRIKLPYTELPELEQITAFFSAAITDLLKSRETLKKESTGSLMRYFQGCLDKDELPTIVSLQPQYGKNTAKNFWEKTLEELPNFSPELYNKLKQEKCIPLDYNAGYSIERIAAEIIKEIAELCINNPQQNVKPIQQGLQDCSP